MRCNHHGEQYKVFSYAAINSQSKHKKKLHFDDCCRKSEVERWGEQLWALWGSLENCGCKFLRVNHLVYFDESFGIVGELVF